MTCDKAQRLEARAIGRLERRLQNDAIESSGKTMHDEDSLLSSATYISEAKKV